MIGELKNIPSNLSKTPPCPGNKLPESFTPPLLFNKDSLKSPSIPKTLIISDITIQCKDALIVESA